MKTNAFSIDFRKFVLMLLPSALHKMFFYHWLYALLAPLITIYKSFYKRRMLNLYIAKYDSGKGNIERMLNLLYDESEKRIYISNNTDSSAEIVPLYLTDDLAADGIYLDEYSYLDGYNVSKLFTIYIPSDLESKKDDIYNRAKMYVLPGVGFSVAVSNE